MVAIGEHSTIFGPALAGVGKSSTLTFMVLDEAAQTPFDIVHWRILFPTDKPEIEEPGLFTAATVPVPVITLHVPTPTPGVFPAKIVLPGLIQIVCDGPATELVGISST